MATNKQVTYSTNQIISFGDCVLVYRSSPAKWIGPYRLLGIDQNQIVIDEKNRGVP